MKHLHKYKRGSEGEKFTIPLKKNAAQTERCPLKMGRKKVLSSPFLFLGLETRKKTEAGGEKEEIEREVGTEGRRGHA